MGSGVSRTASKTGDKLSTLTKITSTSNPAPRDIMPNASRPQSVQDDASDPDLVLNERMRRLGPVQTTQAYRNPLQAEASSSGLKSAKQVYPSIADLAKQRHTWSAAPNTGVDALHARFRIAEEVNMDFEEMGKPGFLGRRYIEAKILSQILALRDAGALDDRSIEKKYDLRSGLLDQLGNKGTVSAAGYDEKRWD